LALISDLWLPGVGNGEGVSFIVKNNFTNRILLVKKQTYLIIPITVKMKSTHQNTHLEKDGIEKIFQR